MEEEAPFWDVEILSILPQPEVRQILFLLALDGRLLVLKVLLQLAVWCPRKGRVGAWKVTEPLAFLCLTWVGGGEHNPSQPDPPQT